MSALASVLSAARSSWDSNYTIGDPRWRITQLYQLYQLLMDNRDQLVEDFSRVHKFSPEVSEREFALTIGEIHGHLSELTLEKRTQPRRRPGVVEIVSKPVGVCLIISGSSNLWRSAIRPLAASIAAGNVTVVAMPTNVEVQATEIISRVWNQYLDQDCLFLLNSIQLSEVKVVGFDLVKVYGLSPDLSSDAYNHLLISPHTEFHSIMMGCNVALLTEGEKGWSQVARDIAQVSRSERLLLSERLHVVFVRDDDLHELRDYLEKENVSLQVFTSSDTVDLRQTLSGSEKSDNLFVVEVRSIERAMDILVACSSSVQQLAVLGPEAEKIAAFVEGWLPFKTLSVGSFAVPDPAVSSVSPASHTHYSSKAFSRKITKITPSFVALPAAVADIRRSYEHLVRPITPQHSGARMGFFKQVEYAAIVAGASTLMISCVGIFYAMRS